MQSEILSYKLSDDGSVSVWRTYFQGEGSLSLNPEYSHVSDSHGNKSKSIVQASTTPCKRDFVLMGMKWKQDSNIF